MKRGVIGTWLIVSTALVGFGAERAEAASAVRTLNIDLAARIDAVAGSRERFAVDIAHVATPKDSGSWERANEVSVWRYSVRVPSAVSMSMHADRFVLPAGATLSVVGGDAAVTTYTRDSSGSGEIWSRTVRGDSISLELRVATAREREVDFSISSVQAGYRSLGGGAPDHPHYRKLQGSTAQAASEVCLENFACHATAENSLSADATAAIVVGGVALCSGTLVNNARSDGKPYLLTARHCQDGPASSVNVYWDATVACGVTLKTVYDTPTPAFFSFARTVFEQQDVWMLDLGSPPMGARAYFTGWDVTGGAFVGGYSPHHAMGRSRQYVRWFGQASYQTMPRDVLGVGYDSNFWSVVNDVGSVGSGASGGGLFNGEHRIVGVGSLAYLQNGPGSDGACPVDPPPAPGAESAAALYVALSAVWESIADTTSFTNPVTLKSLLDPDNTGARVLNGFQLLQNMTFTRSNELGETGWSERLTWNAPGATSCVASGGFPGDGWEGARATGSSLLLTQYQPGVTTYSLRCSNGTRFAERTQQIAWTERPPFLDLRDTDAYPIYIGGDIHLEWRSNVRPCVASGGGAGDGWAGPKADVQFGTRDVPYIQSGPLTWSITCGSGARAITRQISYEILPVAAELRPVATTMRVNQPVLMIAPKVWGNSCMKTGGAPGDGWAGPFNQGSNTPIVTSSAAGTFTYTLTCSSGATTATHSVDVTFTNDPPTATLTADRTSSQVFPPVPAPSVWPHPNSIEFEWNSNVAPCHIDYDGPGDNDGRFFILGSIHEWPSGSYPDVRIAPGAYVYTLTCGSGADVATSSLNIQWLAHAPTVELRLTDAALAAEGVVVGEDFFIAWSGNVSNCTTSGGAPGDGWAGRLGLESGLGIGKLPAPGTYTYSISCSNGLVSAQDDLQIAVPAADVNFLPHVAQARAGDDSVSVSWTSNVAPCQTSGDWGTSAAPARSGRSLGASTAGTRSYTIRCGTSQIDEATTQIEWLPPRSVDISVNLQSVFVGQPVTLSWTSANVASCRIQRGATVDWFGDLPTSGSRTITRNVPSSDSFFIECDGKVSDFVSVSWIRVDRGAEPFVGPTVSLSVDAATKLVNETVTLTWTSTRASGCYALYGASGDGWSGNLPVSGTRQFRILAAGTYQWGVECTGAPPRANAVVSVTATSPPTPPPSSSSSGGGGSSTGKGGGRVDPLMLAALGLMVLALAACRRDVGVRR